MVHHQLLAAFGRPNDLDRAVPVLVFQVPLPEVGGLSGLMALATAGAAVDLGIKFIILNSPWLVFPWFVFYWCYRLIQLQMRDQPLTVAPSKLFRSVVRAAFSSRRKKLAGALRNAFERERINEAISAVGLDENIRAERLSVEEFGALARAFDRLR